MTVRRIIDLADQQERLTNVQETDARTALTRGLSELLMNREIVGAGRLADLNAVYDVWAVPEVEVDHYPIGVVYSEDDGKYDASAFTPRLIKIAGEGNDAYYLQKACEVILDINVEIYCTDPEQRMVIVMAMEDLFTSTEWMYGIRLELGHYFNAHADYALATSAYVDEADTAERRLRTAAFVVQSSVSVYRNVGVKPTIKPRIVVKT